MRLTDEQIGAELRALRPTPSDRFVADLDERAAAGFPALAKVRAPRRRANRLVPALAAAAALIVAVVLVSTAVDRNRTETTGNGEFFSAPATSGDSGTAAAPSTTLPRGAVEAVPPIPPPPGSGRPRNGRPQVQELSASLSLSTDADKLQDAADGVAQVTDRYHGFVDSSNVHAGGSSGRAFFTLRIPATDLRNALDDLSDLGRVVSRDEGSANITGAYVDAAEAYRDARAKVDSLLEDLRDASSPSEAAAIRQRLEAARQELAASRAALRGVKQRVTYATVSVAIRADGDGNWSIGDAADDAADVLETIGGATLVTLAVLLPLSALLALGWLGARELQRRRREATLDRDYSS